MPKRQTQFILGGTYHILNRGVNKMPIFLSKADYLRFEGLIDYYRFERDIAYAVYRKNKRILDAKKKKLVPLVTILSYCSMPNHFHLQVQAKAKDGIRKFTDKVFISYAMYFNKKYERVGPVYQNRFVSVPMQSVDQFLYLSAYIHRNPMEGNLVNTNESLLAYPYSSFGHYTGFNKKSFIDREPVLSYFKNIRDYLNYVLQSRTTSSFQDPDLLA